MITNSVEVLVFLADLQLQLLNAIKHPDDFFLERSLVSRQVAYLLLEPLALRIHVRVVAVDVLHDAVELVCQSLACVLALHGKD